jgi:hypothetical protein
MVCAAAHLVRLSKVITLFKINRPGGGTIEDVAEGIPKRGFSQLVQALNSMYTSQCLLHFTSPQ